MRLRTVIASVFVAILLLMLTITSWASLDRSVFQAGNLFADRWFIATLCDAYCGFITFYVWVAYRESRWFAKIAWFIAIMGLGNIAMSIYVLLLLGKSRSPVAWHNLLLNEKDEAKS